MYGPLIGPVAAADAALTPTAPPAISGTARVGGALTADDGSWTTTPTATRLHLAALQRERPPLRGDPGRQPRDLPSEAVRLRAHARRQRRCDGGRRLAVGVVRADRADPLRERVAPRLALTALCAVLFLTFLDNTIVSVALADMQKSLRTGVSSLQWIVDGYMLAFAGLMLIGGTLGDLLGRKKIMLGGVVALLRRLARGRPRARPATC